MNELLKKDNIVVQIASSLSVRDYLSFSQTNELVFNATRAVADEDYFKDKITKLFIIFDKDYTEDLLFERDATSVLDVKRTSDPKSTVINIYRYLKPYLKKVEAVDLNELEAEATEYDFDRLFDYKSISSQDKAKILKNIQRFIEMDDSDFDFHAREVAKIRTLVHLFVNKTFDELRDNFHRKEYSIVNLLVETLNILDQEDILVEFFIGENKFPEDFFPKTILDAGNKLIEESLDDVIQDLIKFFNSQAFVIDECFSDQLPVMFMYSEYVIDKHIVNKFILQESLKDIEVVPLAYKKLLNDFVGELLPSKNAGENYKQIVSRFINLYFEPLIDRFLELNIANMKQDSIIKIRTFENEFIEQEKQEQDNLYKSILTQYSTDEVKTNKFELLSSFTKIFTAKSNKESTQINFRVNFEMLNKNLKNLKTFINFELSYQIMEDAKHKIELISQFNEINNSMLKPQQINNQIEELFKCLVLIIGQEHIKPGFEKAVELLTKYDPNEFKSLDTLESVNTVEPLVKFTELINVGDLIQQMIEIFYSNELVSKKIVDKNEFLNNTNQVKKQFETMLDNFVANGLNIGIDKLMDEIEFLFNTLQLINDFNPKLKDPDNPEIINPGPTKCAATVVELLSNHINLLNGSTEKGIIDVFQQEIGERFFQLICKNIKKRLISSTGAIILISDLNLYYDFIVNVLKQKNITPLFVGLKEVAQLYLIQTKDSKDLGKLIGDLNKFNGIFKQEEIYEFVQRRSDWFKIKKHVEKAMYGLGLIDCVIM